MEGGAVSDSAGRETEIAGGKIWTFKRKKVKYDNEC
jgi:hypothetical protein